MVIQPRNFLFILLLLTLLTPTILAETQEEQDLIYKVENAVDLKIPCEFNGTICSTSSQCNLSTIFPSGVSLITNQPMTQGTPYHNYTFSGTQLNATGKYYNTVSCCDQNSCDTTTFTFLVTPSGTVNSISQSIIYIALLVLSVGLFLLTMFGAIRIPLSNRVDRNSPIYDVNYYKHVKTFLWFFSYLLFIWIMFISYNLSSSFLEFDFPSNLFWVIYSFCLQMIFPIFALYIGLTILLFLNDKKIQKFLDRGFNPR